MFRDYLYLLVYMLISFILSALIFFISYFLIRRFSDPEKISSYECGFNPFSDARAAFEIKFYLVSILFIIFDLEIVFLFPWVVSVVWIGKFSFYSMMFFLLVLTVGFIYEWKKGALDWTN